MRSETTLDDLWRLGEDVLVATFQEILAKHGSADRRMLIQQAAAAHGVSPLSPSSPLNAWDRDAHVHHLFERLFWEWTSAAFVQPQLTAQGSGSYISMVTLTEAGRRVFDGQPTHALHPKYLADIADLPDGVVAHLDDATSCLRHGLLRAAVVMVGLAYEVVIEEQGVPPILSRNASKLAARDKVTALRKRVEAEDEDHGGKSALLRALVAADSAVGDRNTAAHPRPLTIEQHEVGEAVSRAPIFLRTLRTLGAWLPPVPPRTP